MNPVTLTFSEWVTVCAALITVQEKALSDDIQNQIFGKVRADS